VGPYPLFLSADSHHLANTHHTYYSAIIDRTVVYGCTHNPHTQWRRKVASLLLMLVMIMIMSYRYGDWCLLMGLCGRLAVRFRRRLHQLHPHNTHSRPGGHILRPTRLVSPHTRAHGPLSFTYVLAKTCGCL
jgi:hypothetical protein